MIRSRRLLLFVTLTLVLASLGCGGAGTTTAEPSPPPPEGAPKVTLRNGSAINGPVMDFARPRDFPFTIANTGGAPLELTLTSKSCSCADVEVPGPIAPGTEGKLVVHWSPIPGSAGAYTLSADVQTNDPTNKTLHFSITAHIQPLVRVFVEGKESNPDGEFGLDFTVPPISPAQPRSGEITVFSKKLTSFDLHAACSVPGFDVKATPLPADAHVGNYENVVGYKVEVRSTKDLPIGYSRGVINLDLKKLGNGEPDRTIAVPLVAISSGGGFTTKPDLLLFKKPKFTEKDTASVMLTIYSPPAKEEVTVDSFQPNFLQVDKPEQAGPGRWRITAHLPGNIPETAKGQADPPQIGYVKLKVAGLDRPVNIEVKWDPEVPPK